MFYGLFAPAFMSSVYSKVLHNMFYVAIVLVSFIVCTVDTETRGSLISF